MGSDGVVVALEPVELALQGREVCCGWLRAEPLLLGLVESFDLALGLGVVGPGVVQSDAEQVELDLEGDASAAAGVAGVDGSVVGEHRAGDAVATEGAPEVGQDIGAGGAGSGFATQCEAGVVVEEVVDLHPSAVGELPVGGVACQRSFGRSASNRVLVLLGRLRGCGVTKPRRVRTRQIVETAGTRSTPSRVR